MQDQPRLHVDPDTALLQDDATVPMREDQAHYLGVVLRRGPGDGVRLFNGRDGEWEAVIEHLHKRGRGSFRLRSRVRPPVSEDGPVLLFAPLKRDATDLVVRMATELGVRAIRPVLTERTNASRVNLDRLRAIATEAAEQCERLTIPDIVEPVRLPDLLGEWPPGACPVGRDRTIRGRSAARAGGRAADRSGRRLRPARAAPAALAPLRRRRLARRPDPARRHCLQAAGLRLGCRPPASDGGWCPRVRHRYESQR